VGSDYEPLELMKRLVFLGYERLPEVESVGHFARRGGILDIYPVGLADPLRLEFDGDTLISIAALRFRHPALARAAPGGAILPRFEVVIAPEEAEAVAARLREAGDDKAGGEFLFHDGMERFAGHYDPELARCSTICPRTRSCCSTIRESCASARRTSTP